MKREVNFQKFQHIPDITEHSLKSAYFLRELNSVVFPKKGDFT